MSLEVACSEYLDEVRKFADSIGKSSQLAGELSFLQHYSDGAGVCVLGKDFAPHSFRFAMYRVSPEEGRKFWFNGGLIFHAGADQDFGFPVLSGTLSGRKDSRWEIHT